MASPRTCTEMVEIGDLEADIREVGEVQEEQGEDKEEARENGEVFSSCGDAAVVVMSEITPLLDSAIHAVQNTPKMNIFSVSYPRSRSKEMVNKQVESDLSSLYQFMLWIWSGSKYSGFLCMAVSSVGYCIMELLLEIFSGLSCSFLGVLFIFSPAFSVNGVLPETLDDTSTSGVNLNVYDVIIGIVSSSMGGISYCFIRAGAKASDQPVYGVYFLPFNVVVHVMHIQEIVVPDVGSLIFMIVLGILAFIAEVFLSRGLQIEKTSKVTNILYIQIILLEVSATVLLGELPSIVRLTGCALISASILATICLGPERVSE